MGVYSLHVLQAMFECYKIFCVLYGYSNASAIDCILLKGQGICIVYPCEAIEVYYIIDTNHKLSDDIRIFNNNIQ